MSFTGEDDLGALYDYIMSLPKDQQDEALFNLQSISETNRLTGNGMLDPYSIDLSTGFGDLIPEVNSKGEAQPPDISTINQNYTRVKSENALAVDNASAMLGGAAAYGPQAFTPTMEYSGQLLENEQPGQTMLARTAKGTGWRALLAQEMMANGGDGDAAVAKLVRLAMIPDEVAAQDPPQQQQMRATILATLPPNFEVPDPAEALKQADVTLTPEQQFAQKYNVQALYGAAGDLTNAIMSDPDIKQGYTDPTTGAVYAQPPKSIPSAAAKWYTDRGLPLPTDTYDSPEAMDQLTDPQAMADFGQQQLTLNQTANTAFGKERKASTDYEEAKKAWAPVLAKQKQYQDFQGSPMMAGLNSPGGPSGGPQAPAAMGRFLAGNPAAAATPTPLQAGPIAPTGYNPSDAQQASQMEGALASQWDIAQPTAPPEQRTPAPYQTPGELKPFVLNGTPGAMDFGGADDALTAVIAQMVTGNKNPKVPDQLTPARIAALKKVRDQYGQQFIKANEDRFRNQYLGVTPGIEARLDALNLARSGHQPLVDALRARQTVNRNQVYG